MCRSSRPHAGRVADRAGLAEFERHVLKLDLRADARFARLRGGDAAVGAVGLQLAGLDVVGQDDAQDAVDQPPPELGIFDRET